MKLLRLAAALSALVAATSSLSAGSVQEGTDKPTGYGRISRADARILNMPDEQATEILRPGKGALVAVFRDLGDWVEVEVPGGYAVWVFGRYLTETAEKDVFRVNGDGVNLRPKPSRGVPNYPLSQQLYAGDRVRVIERADPSVPLGEDWVRIWSPAGVHAWVAKGSVTDLAAGEQGAGLWKKALAELPAAPIRAKAARDAASAKAPSPEQLAAAKKQEEEREAAFSSELEAAWKRMEDEAAKEAPEWEAVRAAFAEAERKAGSSADRIQVRQGLDRLANYEELGRMRESLEAQRRELEEAARREKERVVEESREKDPLGGVFLARGSLERVGQGEGTRYLLRFGKDVIAETVCISGRYDLDVFVGYQIGVKGMELQAAAGDELRQIEVTRLEVIARRP
ncbi:MAG: hypothetical protein AAF682_18285 [Planctomycetota bacterium]